MTTTAEFILEPGVTPVLLVAPYGPSFAAAKEKLGETKGVQVVECSSSMDAVALARRIEVCLIVFHASDQEALVKHVTMLKLLQGSIRQGKIRSILSTTFRQGTLYDKIETFGVNEIMVEPVSAKSLLFKIDRNLKMLPQSGGEAAVPAKGQPSQQSKASSEIVLDDSTDPDSVQPVSAAEGASKGKGRKSASSGAAASAPKAQGDASASTVNLVDALALQSDFWLMAGGGAKKIGGKWIIKLTGPGPSVGRWARVEDGAHGTAPGKDHWQWIPLSPETDLFHQEQGAWIFHGQRPEFQDKVWMFVSRTPDLSFVYEGESYGTKFTLDNAGTLLISKDSTAALGFLDAIQNSLVQTNRGNEKKARTDAAAPVEKTAKKKEASLLDTSEKAAEPEFKQTEPLALESDVWLLDNRRPKRITKRWVTKLMGPGPNAGRWIPLESEDHTDAFWQWVPTDAEKDPFIKEQGAWVFRGLLPKFEEDVWVFVGKNPELAFWYEGESYGAKISCDETRSIVIARDSENARKMMPLIVASIEKVIKTTGDDRDVQEMLTLQKRAKEEAEREKQAEAALAGVEEVPQLPVAGPRESGAAAAEAEVPAAFAAEPVGETETEADTEAEPEAEAEAESEAGAPPVKGAKKKAGRESEPATLSYRKQRKTGGSSSSADEGRPETQDFVLSADKPRGGAADYREKKKSASGDEFTTFKKEGPAGELRDRRGPRAQEKAESREFRVPEAEIGAAGGVWEYVTANATGGKWFVYVPIELLSRVVDDARALPKYWIYCGKHKPELRGTDWVFLDQPPEAVPLFSKLIRPIQSFLVDTLANFAFGQGAGGEDLEYEGTGASRKKKKKSKRGPDSPGEEVQEAAVQLGPEGPQAVRAAEPPGPSLSPLALAFLMSELLCKRGLDRRLMSQRYCAYLSASCGGLRAELWVCYGDRWVCAGSQDGSEGQLGEAVASQAATGETALGASGVLVAPIGNGPKGSGAVVGALALSGPGIELVAAHYAWAAGRMARGLVQSLAEAEIPLDQVA